MRTLIEHKRTLSPTDMAIVATEMTRLHKSVGVAYLLWWVAGTLGAHQFYLGNIRAGVPMLAVPVVSVLLLVLGSQYPSAWTLLAEVLLGGGGALVLRLLYDVVTLPWQCDRVNQQREAWLIQDVTGHPRP